jgi:hypothetical protein
MTPSIEPTEKDFQEACEYLVGSPRCWERIKAEARRRAVLRLLSINQHETELALTEAKSFSGENIDAYLKVQDRISRLFEDHDKLMRIAEVST